jgi:hypothetical protein
MRADDVVRTGVTRAERRRGDSGGSVKPSEPKRKEAAASGKGRAGLARGKKAPKASKKGRPMLQTSLTTTKKKPPKAKKRR